MKSGIKDMEFYRQQSRVMKVFANPLRLAMFDFLHTGEQCVCHVADRFDTSYATASKHLAKLQELGVVTSRREGTSIIYSVRKSCAPNLLGCINRIIEARFQEHHELHQRLRKAGLG